MEFEKVARCPLCAGKRRSLWNRRREDLSAVRCATCGLVYMDKRFTEESARGFYADYNRGRDAKKRALLAQRKTMYRIDREFVQLFLAKGSFLDIGCGSGEFLSLFGPRVKKTGYDLDAAARGRLRMVDSLEDLKETFDAVIFRGTLQYQRDLAATARFCAKRVKPGGYLFLLATPNAEAPAAVLQREKWALFSKWEHLYHFSLGTIGKLFKGFDVARFEFPYLGTPYESREEDLRKFIALCGGKEVGKFPFWGSMMNVALRRA